MEMARMTILARALFFIAAMLTGILLVSPPGGKAQGKSPPGLDVSVQQEPFLALAHQFMAAAAAGDAAKAKALISPATAARAGPEGVEQYMAQQVLPFFGEFKDIGKSVTVTRTAEVTGFAFYMYMVTRTGELRPFVIYVIEEGGANVVANVLVDHFVEGRHCAKVEGGWQCPDFSG
jgi:hypothetical protein